ncbi:MAG: type II toxin-antitoxin system VapC family toxin [Actinobacteria bacterium]|nr:type II toxin-antitoxin system VapC family toxin [Actinomycetota bacterium]
MIDYVDTSAYLKLLIEEPESALLAETLERARTDGRLLVSSMLLTTELRRAAWRLAIPLTEIDAELEKINLISVADSTFARAGAFPDPRLRSLDAIHLATAIECDATTIYTYDSRLSDAARGVGIVVSAPSPAPSN